MTAPRLTAAELDAHNAEFHPADRIEPIESVESENPFVWLIYAIGAAAGCAASALWPLPVTP